MNKKKDEKIFPILDPIHTTQPDTLDGIIFDDSPEIDRSEFPLVLIDTDTIIIPVTTFKGYGEIGSNVLISNSFLSKTTIKNGSKIIDSRIFTGIIHNETVIINSTIEGSVFNEKCYANNCTIIESVLGKEVIICGSSNINRSRIYDEVVLSPQVIVDNGKVEKFCYLESGVKLIGQKGRYGDAVVILKPKVYVGANSLIIGPALIDHNCYIDSDVVIEPSNLIGIFIPPFSYIRRSDNKKGYEVLEKRSFYLIDGLWYVAKDTPIEISLIREVKNKLEFIEKKLKEKKEDIKEVLTNKNTKAGNQPPIQLLLYNDGLKKFKEFLNRMMESLVN
ncbi:MAG: hypothetical protein N2692_00255 [Patescibacteria group bacterium]|nr:hypothetical protein [Patescibacteria group bacterium]